MRAAGWFRHRLRVRYQETDQMGVVYHANYLNWFEIGRTELIRELGFPYRRIEELGLLLPVLDLDMKFRMPAKYDDNVTVWTRIAEYSHIKVSFESQVRRTPEDGGSAAGESDGLLEPSGELLVSGATRHMWLNRSWKPARLDREAPELYKLLGEG